MPALGGARKTESRSSVWGGLGWWGLGVVVERGVVVVVVVREEKPFLVVVVVVVVVVGWVWEERCLERREARRLAFLEKLKATVLVCSGRTGAIGGREGGSGILEGGWSGELNVGWGCWSLRLKRQFDLV